MSLNYFKTIWSDSPALVYALIDGTAPQDFAGNGTLTAANVAYGDRAILAGSPCCIFFNGPSGAVLNGGPTTLAAANPTTALSLEAWIRPQRVTNSGTDMTLISKGAATQYELIIDGTSGVVKLRIGASIVATGVTALQVGQQYHIVATASTSACAIWINGVLDVTAAGLGGAIPTTSSAFTIGARSDGKYYSGSLAWAALYGAVLSSAQIAAHYLAGITQGGQPAFGGDASVFSMMVAATPNAPNITWRGDSIPSRWSAQVAGAFNPNNWGGEIIGVSGAINGSQSTPGSQLTIPASQAYSPLLSYSPIYGPSQSTLVSSLSAGAFKLQIASYPGASGTAPFGGAPAAGMYMTINPGGANQETVQIDPAWLTGQNGATVPAANVTIGPYMSATQSLTFTGSPTAGTAVLNILGDNNTVCTISSGALNTDIQTALNGLSYVGAGGSTVSGTFPGPYAIQFAAPQGKLTLKTNSLTGGTSPTVSINSGGGFASTHSAAEVVTWTRPSLMNSAYYRGFNSEIILAPGYTWGANPAGLSTGNRIYEAAFTNESGNVSSPFLGSAPATLTLFYLAHPKGVPSVNIWAVPEQAGTTSALMTNISTYSATPSIGSVSFTIPNVSNWTTAGANYLLRAQMPPGLISQEYVFIPLSTKFSSGTPGLTIQSGTCMSGFQIEHFIESATCTIAFDQQYATAAGQNMMMIQLGVNGLNFPETITTSYTKLVKTVYQLQGGTAPDSTVITGPANQPNLRVLFINYYCIYISPVANYWMSLAIQQAVAYINANGGHAAWIDLSTRYGNPIYNNTNVLVDGEHPTSPAGCQLLAAASWGLIRAAYDANQAQSLSAAVVQAGLTAQGFTTTAATALAKVNATSGYLSVDVAAVNGNTSSSLLPGTSLQSANILAAVGTPMQSNSTVVLAPSQPSYAPAKAGEQMDFVNSPNATAVAALQTGLATFGSQAALAAAIAAIPTATANANAVDTKLSGAHGSGTWGGSSAGVGARAVTVTVTDADSNPISNATVRLGTAWTQTNGSGVASLAVDDGTYTIAVTHGGYTFSPASETISSTATALSVTMSSVSIEAPANPNMIVGVANTLAAGGSNIAPNVAVEFVMTTPPVGESGNIYPQRFTASSDQNGLLQVQLAKGATYYISARFGQRSQVTVPGSGTQFNLPDLIAGCE